MTRFHPACSRYRFPIPGILCKTWYTQGKQMTGEDTWITMKLWVLYSLIWFQNYLYSHMQCVTIGKARSHLKQINSGDTQGSILGPLLFIIIMNDLLATVNSCQIQLYADDTILYCHGEKADEVRQKLTTGFQIMVKWFRENWVRVNVKKTHTMFLGRKKRLPQLQHISVEHEGQTLASKKSVKYLFWCIYR